MNRNKYSKDFEQEMTNISKNHTLDELLNCANKKYKYNITKDQLRKYLSKRKIRYKDYHKNKRRIMNNQLSIGTEYTKSDGMVLIKVSPTKWMYKQRYIYEKHYNVKLTSDDYIIFLDHNRNNFSIDNLKKVTRYESSILSNQNLFSTNKDVTLTGLSIAKLIIKTKQTLSKKTN